MILNNLGLMTISHERIGLWAKGIVSDLLKAAALRYRSIKEITGKVRILTKVSRSLFAWEYVSHPLKYLLLFLSNCLIVHSSFFSFSVLLSLHLIHVRQLGCGMGVLRLALHCLPQFSVVSKMHPPKFDANGQQ